MTALKEYLRLETTGLWRASADAQRRDVFVSVGQATLVIADKTDAPLAHWSLAAVERLNPGSRPAVFAPGRDADESLEISDGEMIDAIERVQSAVRKSDPHPGRLRLWIALSCFLGVLGLGAFWLPGAVAKHAANALPEVQKAAIGEELFNEMQRLTGPACGKEDHDAVLQRLATRTFGADAPKLHVLRNGVSDALVLPGGTILLSRNLLEDHETSAPAAGYLIAAQVKAETSPPFVALLDTAGLPAVLRLLTTGRLPSSALQRHAQNLARQSSEPVTDPALADAFARSRIPVLPYALAVDITGETTSALITADPYRDTQAPVVLDDNSWVILQGICAG
ncbi:MAG: hypothetical protein QNI90_08980 [Dinoroseobacter sp.]|nr:hypothetical protein [Dinoroseobacter sp.]